LRILTVDWILRFLAIAIVVVLVWFANLGRPVQFADITGQPKTSPYIDSFVLTGAGRVDQGSVPLHVTGMLTEAGAFATVLELDTQQSGQSRWQKSACCDLLGKSFDGSANLSVVSAQALDFQLVSIGDYGHNTVLTTGTLTVDLESFPGGSQLAINIIGGLGAAAVVLEILRLVVRRRTAIKPVPSTGQGEPNA
jgi:hypothetical protein